MHEKFRNKYRIPSARLQNWDYGWNAKYFVTICTKNREHLFGEIANGNMELSEIGKYAQKFWLEIPAHFPFIDLGAFVIMPNHMHGILTINKTENSNNVETRQCLVSTIPDTIPPCDDKINIGQKRYQNQGKNTLSSVIGSYKSIVTKISRRIHADFAWQDRFHDHIIRNEISFTRISDYILNNPAKWTEDKFFS
jgi:putative transposase